MNAKVVQVMVYVGHAGLSCAGFLEIPDGVDMADLSSRLSSLNRYSGDSHIQSTRFNFAIVDRPAAPEPAQPAEPPAKPVKAKKEPKVKDDKPKAKAAAKKPAKKNTGKKQGDLL